MNDASSASGRVRGAVLGAFALSGCAALAYEVVWTRALAIVLGSTTYALATMLATFMLGLAIGGFLGGRLAGRGGTPLRLFGLMELGIGALGIVSHLVIEAIPALHLAAYRAFHLSTPAYFAAQLLLCALVMLAPTILMGTTFPLVTAALVMDVREVGRTVGLAYGANTLGSVTGSLLAGFVLVPSLGLRGSTFAAAGINAAVGTFLLARRGVGRSRLTLLLVLVYVPLVAAALTSERDSTLVNFLSASRYLNEGSYEQQVAAARAGMVKVYEREGVAGYVAAYRTATGHLLLQVGGKLEGTGVSDMDNTLLLAYLPAVAHPAPKSALVIGLGAGVTLDAAKRVYSRVDLAEISEEVLEAVRLHGPPGVLEGIGVQRDDARHFLLTTERHWDVITSEPSYPTEFAVANLFSLEFYRMAAERLEPGGIFCQWLPYYVLTNDDVTMMVKTFATAFPYASLWRVEGSLDLLLLGSLRPFARPMDEVLARVKALPTERPLQVKLSRTPEQVRAVAARSDVPLNTDDFPRLEFAVARSFRIGDLAAIER